MKPSKSKPLEDAEERKLAVESAGEYFKAANVVTAFFVGQTLLLLNSFSQENQIVVATLARWRPFSSAITVATTVGYIFVVAACFLPEFRFRRAARQSPVFVRSSVYAFVVRLLVILFISSFYQKIFVEVCLEEHASNPTPKVAPLPSSPPAIIFWLDKQVFGKRQAEIDHPKTK